MTLQTVLLPLFVEVLLTFVLLFWMGALRVKAIRRGEVHPRDIALREPNWPKKLLQVQWAFHNQLETPVLFYVLTILALFTRHADLIFVVLAWIYVALRIVHAYIHVTSNYVAHRGLVFISSCIVLAVMWAIFIIRVLLGI